MLSVDFLGAKFILKDIYSTRDVIYYLVIRILKLVRVSINIQDVNVAYRFTSLTSTVHYSK